MSEGLIFIDARGRHSMRKSLVLAVCAVAFIATGARAQTVEVPNVYAIALPPMLEPRFEIGARYWQSVGKTRFSLNSSKSNPAFGNPPPC
jgi:hypothetical protein